MAGSFLRPNLRSNLRSGVPARLSSRALLALLTALAVCVANLPVWASGSVGPGSVRTGKSIARADYARGKSIVYKELVCRGCPIKKRALNRNRARALKASLDRAIEEGVRAARDEHVRLLCSRGVRDEGACKEKLKVVRYYLKRRYRL